MTAIPYAPDQPAAKVHASLRRSLKAMNQARKCSVLWFAEIMNRHLYRDLGHATINQYAMNELGFSKSRTGDFIRLARQLENLPAVRQALTNGDLGYTKAREIVAVATPETQDSWLEAAKGTRKELILEVKKVKRAAKVDPRQDELLPARPLVVSPREVPVRLQVDFSPEQEARRAALVERLHKLGVAPAGRAELILEALAALVEISEGEKAPRGALASRPPVQIHVHETAGKMTVQTQAGERDLGRAEAERVRCDASVSRPGKRNTTTIPPRTRREVMARDRHVCQVPGCDRTRFLEVHHLVPRSRGGKNTRDNLVTLCGSCHRMSHERGGLGLRDYFIPSG
jgi:hypothetical protein